MRIGEQIQVLREARGIGQAELAEAAGVHQVTLSQWERGTRRFDGDKLRPICQALGVESGVFMNPFPWDRLETARDNAQREIDAAMEEVRKLLADKNTAHDPLDIAAHDTSLLASHVGDSDDSDDMMSHQVPGLLVLA